MIQLYKNLLKEIEELTKAYNKLPDNESIGTFEVMLAVINEKKRIVLILETL